MSPILWTCHRPFVLGDQSFRVDVEAGAAVARICLLRDGQVLAEDLTADVAGDARNHRLCATLPDGRQLEVGVGPMSSESACGLVVRVDGRVVHQGDPGREAEAHAAAAREDQERWQRNKPSILADLGLGLLFFAVAKLTGSLTTAALVGAGAGLALVVVQRFVKVDLLGGFALFGVVVLLLSAALAWVFQDDWAVKMRSTIVGSLVALVMLSDGIFNGGRYFGGRIQRYMPTPLDPRRFAIGMGLLGFVMAAVNYIVATWTTGDLWLWYTTFGDTVLSIVLVFAVLQYAQRPSA